MGDMMGAKADLEDMLATAKTSGISEQRFWPLSS